MRAKRIGKMEEKQVNKVIKWRLNLPHIHKVKFDKACYEMSYLKYEDIKNPEISLANIATILKAMKTLPCPHNSCDNLTCRKMKCVKISGVLKCWLKYFYFFIDKKK